MIDVKEFIKVLIDSGLTKEEACLELRKEINKRKENGSSDIIYRNNASELFKENCDKYRR